MAFYFENIKKDIVMTEDDEEEYGNNNICQFFKKYIESEKIRDHCHLTGKNRGPAHNTCNINVKQKDSNFIFYHLPFKILVFTIVICSLRD